MSGLKRAETLERETSHRWVIGGAAARRTRVIMGLVLGLGCQTGGGQATNGSAGPGDLDGEAPSPGFPRPELEQFISSPTGEPGAGFGGAIALQADRLIAVSPLQDLGDSSGPRVDTGAVYEFRRAGEGWDGPTEIARPKAQDGDGVFALDTASTGVPIYPYSTALQGPELIVGAAGADCVDPDGGSLADCGVVTVHQREGDEYVARQVLTASNGEAGDHFGYRVAVDGPWLAVSAMSEDSRPNEGAFDNSSEDSGAVYLFVRRAEGFVQHAMLKAFNGDAHDHFGSSLALLGDTLVVGAVNESSGSALGVDNSVSHAGAAYVYRMDRYENWELEAILKSENPRENDGLGYAVALGLDRIAVGAWAAGRTPAPVETDDDGGFVLVYRRGEDGWLRERRLWANKVTQLFGAALALDEHTLWIGAPGEAHDRKASGAVHVFHFESEDKQRIVPRNGEAADLFGSWIALDAAGGAAIAAPGKNGPAAPEGTNAQERAGAVYLYRY